MTTYYTQQQVQNFEQQTFAHLLVTQQQNCLSITLNRPEQKNALNTTLSNELAYALSYAHHNPSIWMVVIKAAGTVFCAGADLKSFAGNTSATNTSTIPQPTETVLIGNALQSLQKPSIARLHAPVYAGGTLIIGGCNFVVATPNATLSLPEVKRGLFPMQVMQTLLQIMPPKQVLNLCLLGQTITPQQAYNLQLYTHLVTSEQELDQTIDNICHEICQNSPSAIQLGFKALQELLLTNPENPHQFLYQKLVDVLKTQDAMEGIAAFTQKRTPKWTGQ